MRWQDALSSYDRAIAIRGPYPEAHLNRGEKELREKYLLNDLGISLDHLKTLKEHFLSLNLHSLPDKFDKFLTNHLKITTGKFNVDNKEWIPSTNQELWEEIESVLFKDTSAWMTLCNELKFLGEFNQFTLHRVKAG